MKINLEDWIFHCQFIKHSDVKLKETIYKMVEIYEFYKYIPIILT